MQKQPIHVLLQGESGHGKDTFAATFPAPRLVLHLDGTGKETPYIDNLILGKAQQVGEIQEYQLGGSLIKYRDVVDAVGEVTRIEYYSSDNPTMPNMSLALETRMSFFTQEQGSWATLICGTLGSAAVESRYYEQFVLNPQFKDPRKWYGAATEYVERLIFMQKALLKCNVVFTCHIGQNKNEVGGEILFTPDLPGRLSYGAGRYFSEMYRIFIWRDQEGRALRWLQTDGDGRYQCQTHIRAPNPIGPDPTYGKLWGK